MKRDEGKEVLVCRRCGYLQSDVRRFKRENGRKMPCSYPYKFHKYKYDKIKSR